MRRQVVPRRPRSFVLIVGDDVSQNAFSVFIGAFIFSVVALVAGMNGLNSGRVSQFILFSLTILVLIAIIITFIWWVDNIARLGRLGHTIDKVETTAGSRRFCSRTRGSQMCNVAGSTGSVGLRDGLFVGHFRSTDAGDDRSGASRQSCLNMWS